jgi:hypothetical protein
LSSSIEEEGTFRVPRLTLCSALKVNSSLSSLESDGRLVAEGSLALYRNFTISRQGFSITLRRPNIFSFIYRKDIDARHSRDTHARVCLSRWRAKEEDADQTKRFFYTIPNGKRLKYFFFFFFYV